MADYTIFGTGTPTGSAQHAAGAFNLGTEFMVTTSPVWLIGLKLWRFSTSLSGTPTGRVYSVTTATTGSAVANSDATFQTFTSGGGTTGWFTTTTSDSVLLTPNQRYRVAIRFPSGFSAINSYWSTGAGASGVTSGPLYGFRYAASQTTDSSTIQSSYNSDGTLTFPQTLASPAGNSYFCDVTVTDTDPAGLRQTEFFASQL